MRYLFTHLIFCCFWSFQVAAQGGELTTTRIPHIAAVTAKNPDYDAANFLSKKAGARVIEVFPADSLGFPADNVIDDMQGAKGVWKISNRLKRKPYVVFELPTREHITTLAFNTQEISDKAIEGIGCSRISIEISDASSAGPFKKVADGFLKKNQLHQVISIESTYCRWIRLTLEANWNHADLIALGRIYAYNDVLGNEYETRMSSEGVLDISDLRFASNSAMITEASIPILETVAQLLDAHPEWNVLIEGHTDSEGTEAANLKLSKLRAATVLELLVQAGIARERLQANGYGSSRPLNGELSDADKALNRRVTFRLMR